MFDLSDMPLIDYSSHQGISSALVANHSNALNNRDDVIVAVQAFVGSDVKTSDLAKFALVCDGMSDSPGISAESRNAALAYYASLVAEGQFESLRWESAEILVYHGFSLQYVQSLVSGFAD